jgi:head-tail adaptor
MREGQQRRWAKVRGESQVSATETPRETSKPKRKISVAGRKVISAAMKKRWAAKKAAA